jgi:hypothetical protein
MRNGHYCFLSEGLGRTPASRPRLAHFIACTRECRSEICTLWSSESAHSSLLTGGSDMEPLLRRDDCANAAHAIADARIPPEPSEERFMRWG